MQLSESQLRAFNRPDSLLVISTYPDQNTTHTGGGLAIYTKNTLLAIKKADPNKRIIVLANITDEKEIYLEKGILIVRCWERSLLKLYLPLIKNISQLSSVKDIFVGFEFAAYGDFLTTGLLAPFLSLLKLSGKKIVTVVHQVVLDLKSLATHAGIDKNKNLKIYNQSLTLFFKSLSFASRKVVTLEPILAVRFNDLTGTNKAVCIPHGLYPKITVDKKEAQKKLNLNPKNLYVLCLGYLSHYKGSDIIVKAFKKPLTVRGKRVRLILAGGENPTQGQKYHYRRFYKNLYRAIDSNPNIITTGFVPETRIKSYYSAADLVAFPYRAFMSASGPLSLAIAYKKPFVVSNELKNYTEATFTNSTASIRYTIKKILAKKANLNNLVRVSQNMSLERNFNLQGSKYLDLFR